MTLLHPQFNLTLISKMAYIKIIIRSTFGIDRTNKVNKTTNYNVKRKKHVNSLKFTGGKVKRLTPKND